MKNGLPLVRSSIASRQRRNAGVLAQMIVEQVADGVRGQRLQRQMLVIRALHPARLIFRPEIHQQQIAAGGDALDGGFQERVAGAVEPVQIFQHENSGAGAAMGGIVQHPLDHAVQALLALFRDRSPAPGSPGPARRTNRR